MRSERTGRRVDQVGAPERVSQACPWHRRSSPSPCGLLLRHSSPRNRNTATDLIWNAFRAIPAIPAATACAQQQRAREGAAPGLGGHLRHRSPRGPGRHTKAGCNPTQFVEDYGGFLGHFEMVLDKDQLGRLRPVRRAASTTLIDHSRSAQQEARLTASARVIEAGWGREALADLRVASATRSIKTAMNLPKTHSSRSED